MPDEQASISLSPKTIFALGVAFGILLAGAAGFVWTVSSGGAKVPAANTNTPPAVVTGDQPGGQVAAQPVQPTTDDDHVRGKQDAAVTLIEYSDFECPFCQSFSGSVAQALQEFPNDVRLVYRHFPLEQIHPNSLKAAEASECAAEQGKFWEMHDQLFALQGQSGFNVEGFKQAAVRLRLNTGQFNTCLDSGKYNGKVIAQQSSGLSAGVEGTPTTFVNGVAVRGAVPYENLKAAITDALGR